MQPELVDGAEKRLTARIDKDRVGAVDWTFNVPKSVSVAELVANDTRITEIRIEAVKAAMRAIEKQSRVRVRKSAEIAKGKPKTWKFPARYTDNLTYELYGHPGARDGSPHAHVHAKIYNLSYDKAEKQWKAVELRYVDRKAVCDLYHKELRRGLNQLGYKTKTVGKSFEITGFPAEIKGLFSSRHTAIKGMEADYEAKAGKPLSSKAKGKLSVYNRPEKPDNIPLPERRKGWLERLTPSQVSSLMGVVNKSRHAVKASRLRSGMKRHIDRLVSAVITRPTITPSKDQGRGR